MLHVCYMFSKHITCFKASGYRGLRPVMLYGYMFLRNSFFIQHKGTEIQSLLFFLPVFVSPYLPKYCMGVAKPRASRVEGTGFVGHGDYL